MKKFRTFGVLHDLCYQRILHNFFIVLYSFYNFMFLYDCLYCVVQSGDHPHILLQKFSKAVYFSVTSFCFPEFCDFLLHVFIIRKDSVQASDSRVTLPVYLNSARAQLLFTLDFNTQGEGSGENHSFYERGVGIITSTLGYN